MSEAFGVFVAAVTTAAARLEQAPAHSPAGVSQPALECAIVHHLPGAIGLAQQRQRLHVEGFAPDPLGVNIDWRHDGVHAGVETAVTDVADGLFDVVKLATAIRAGLFDEGYCAVAATERQWHGGGSFTAMTKAPAGRWFSWRLADVLSAPDARDVVLVASGPRPHTVPATIQTMTTAPIAMAGAPTHELRLLAVRPAAAAGTLQLPA